MSRQLKELRSLMPWTWDARIDEHPAGKSSLRDFKDVYCWTGDEKGRRSNASPRGSSAATLPRKRPPKGELSNSASDAPPQSTPCSKQVVGAALQQTPNTRDSAASSGGHLSVPKATPVTGLRSSGRSSKRQAPVSPPPDAITPAPQPKMLGDQPDSAISTGERLQLQPCSTAPSRETAATDAAIPARPTGETVAATVVHSVAPQSPETQLPAAGCDHMMPHASAASPAGSPDAHHVPPAPSPDKPFEAKLAAVQQDKGLLPVLAAAPAQHDQVQDAPAQPPPAKRLQTEQPESLEHTETDEAEESLAAATLLQLPQQKVAQPTSSSAMQRQPMGELDTNVPRSSAAPDAAKPQPQVLTEQRRKSGLLDAAWAAAGIAKRPPQQKRSARRLPPATRITVPLLLDQFPHRQRSSALPAALTHQMHPVSTAPAAAASAAAMLSPGPAAPRTAPMLPAVEVPSVSAPPPALPELPPIAPLVLQPLRVQLTGEVPALPVAHSDSSACQQAPQQMVVQPMQQCSVAPQSASTRQADGAWAVRPFALPSTSVPLKRPGDPLDLAHACKLLRWMDQLQDKRTHPQRQ